jgi:cytochrome c oxidase cbb3-type subunit 3
MFAAHRPLRLAILFSVLGCGAATGPERELSGESIYRRHCARCHGADGRGTPEVLAAKDLTNRSFIESLSDDRIMATIREGRPPTMPGLGERLAEPSLRVLVAYVRSLSDPTVGSALRPPGEPAE